ncbi:uncharacterized protein LOC105784186 [Gossypium raimondii]|uniref:uncharacterized protein LOC105784186 n=1 Tax=Gossypium raimondii TaxID=29730 RepID=UPI00227C2877|nr:uncharacterized protein LOC105784186 [Gossypium raimondii]
MTLYKRRRMKMPMIIKKESVNEMMMKHSQISDSVFKETITAKKLPTLPSPTFSPQKKGTDNHLRRRVRPKWPSSSFVSSDGLITAMAYHLPHVMEDRSGNICMDGWMYSLVRLGKA